MKLSTNKQNDIVDYESEILNCIRENPGGITITDISKKKSYSRNTVSKYVALLELKEKIFRRKVGAYNLYFSTNTTYFPKEIISTYYKALLSGLKQNFPNNEQIFKEIGRNSLNFIDFSFGPTVKKGLKSLKTIPVPRIYFEAFGKFYPSYDILQPSIEISEPKIDASGKKAIYQFKSSDFLEKSDEFIYHFYIVSGIIEALWERELKTQIKCDIETIHIGNTKQENFIEFSIEIKGIIKNIPNVH